ncbi:MAG: family 1 glycosylhydrolase, partial [Bacteroidales bacterium]|nr:family 1 glycosylhydrolase [Bacteroidales bacterium]
GLYKMIKKFSRYPGVKDIVITESGVCLDDNLENLRVADAERIAYFKDSLSYILKARQKGMPVKGFFAWTLMDNFEWAEGYKPRFGLVYTNYENLERIVKDSGSWFGEFLSDQIR